MRPRFTVLTLLLAALAACSAPAPAPPAADFGISLSDTVLEAVPGGSFTTSITLSPINGFAGTVALTLANRDGSPADPGLTLDPAAVIVPASALTEQSIQRQLTLDIDPLLAPGSFALRLTATSGPLASDADLDLTVAASLIPSVAITSPTAGTTFIGSRDVTVEGTIAAVSGIVDVVIEGADAIADLSFDNTTFTATATLGNNTNTLTATVQDARGRLGTSDPVEVTFPYLALEIFQRASVVIGQPDFVSSDFNRGGAAAADTIGSPLGSSAVAPDGTLFVPDAGNRRVLAFTSIPDANGVAADFVLGQPDFSTTSTTPADYSLGGQSSLDTDGVRLAASDTSYHRVLIWNQIPTTTRASADVVVGQPDVVSTGLGCDAASLFFPEGVAFAGGRLIVADTTNNRVLIWNQIPTSNGEPADVVLGQDSFTSCVHNDDDQDGTPDATPTARTLYSPVGLWSDGKRLVVADHNNARVLIWNQIPASDFAPADLVVGQPDFTTAVFAAGASAYKGPRGVASNGNQLFVVDGSNHRVMVYNTFPTENGAAADVLLGQATFAGTAFDDDDQDGISGSVPSSRTLDGPSGLVVVDGALIVGDFNHRVLVFEGR